MINIDQVQEVRLANHVVQFWNDVTWNCHFDFELADTAEMALDLICDALLRGETLLELTEELYEPVD